MLYETEDEEGDVIGDIDEDESSEYKYNIPAWGIALIVIFVVLIIFGIVAVKMLNKSLKEQNMKLTQIRNLEETQRGVNEFEKKTEVY